MFLVFTLVLLVVAIGILVSVYSVFFPFMQNLGTVQQYHMAYYGAVSSIERAELSLKYRSPGFVGSGGYLGSNIFGPISDYTPEILSGIQEGCFRNINSRTSTIPASGMGNTDPMFAASDSADYNQLGYTYLETFFLGYDATNDVHAYYSGGSHLAFFSGGEVEGLFRLPPKIFSGFGGSPTAELCYNMMGDCDPDGDGISNDIILSRSLEGLYQLQSFKIFPTIAIFYYSGMQIDEPKDNAIRESIINEGGSIHIGTTSIYAYTPIDNGSQLSQHNVISSAANAIEQDGFSTILSSSTYSGLRLSFGATNLFRTLTGAIYPYLEYQFTFPQPVADRFYTIQGNGRVGEYDIQIILKKPTVQGTVGGDFTVIF